jgi:hypothetical protein
MDRLGFAKFNRIVTGPYIWWSCSLFWQSVRCRVGVYPAMWMLWNCKNGASSWEIHRAIGVTQKSAWFMLQRIRLTLQAPVCGAPQPVLELVRAAQLRRDQLTL